ncbi:hypothetical protein HIM_06632 [Hirsutella minnesotensis 3608]|uniref:Enoyl reductase (ER) domain-containing protein n=1 Tax=Hirsutella minnesotensis 3608 TaxID=1043627 RepID=A0A0F8A4Q0_9HYPO|nr:hypothetical protein HIM_06632 [Hirsutella minnesotensis 3608]
MASSIPVRGLQMATTISFCATVKNSAVHLLHGGWHLSSKDSKKFVESFKEINEHNTNSSRLTKNQRFKLQAWAIPTPFTGFCVDGPKTWNQFHKAELKPKPFGQHDIDIEIQACGICCSDAHTLTGGGSKFEGPLCVGHEVVRKAIKVGKHVKEIKEGDRVRAGAQVWACPECDLCKNENENYCPKLVDTYGAQYEDGSWSHGGFASHICAHGYFTFKVYSPLVRAGVGPGKRVGIVGIGGLGNIALQYSVALGAETYALTYSSDKAEDYKKLGAKDVITTTQDNWQEPWKFKFDCILNCADVTDRFNLSDYFSLLKPGADLHMVGLPDEALPQLMAQDFTRNAPKLTGSHLGNNQEMNALLKLAAEKGIKPWVQTIDISEKGCQEAF